jgi:hypothetical protein
MLECIYTFILYICKKGGNFMGTSKPTKSVRSLSTKQKTNKKPVSVQKASRVSVKKSTQSSKNVKKQISRSQGKVVPTRKIVTVPKGKIASSRSVQTTTRVRAKPLKRVVAVTRVKKKIIKVHSREPKRTRFEPRRRSILMRVFGAR